MTDKTEKVANTMATLIALLNHLGHTEVRIYAFDGIMTITTSDDVGNQLIKYDIEVPS